MPVQMTRAEYEAKYGKPAIQQMTRAEYNAKYGQDSIRQALPLLPDAPASDVQGPPVNPNGSSIPGPVMAVGQGLQSGVVRGAAGMARAMGPTAAFGGPGGHPAMYGLQTQTQTLSDASKEVQQYSNELFGKAEQLDQAAREQNPGLLNETIRGATGSAVQMLPMGMLGGPVGAIGGASIIQAGDAAYRADKAGLQGGEKLGFIARDAAIEAIPAATMQAVGLGGAEKLFSKGAGTAIKRGFKEGLKQLGYAAAQEVPEELVTSYGQLLNERLTPGVNPEQLTAKDWYETTRDTVLQTALTVGIVGGVTIPGQQRAAGQQALQDARALRQQKSDIRKERIAPGAPTGQPLGPVDLVNAPEVPVQTTQRIDVQESELATSPLSDIITAAAAEQGLDPSVIHTVVNIESGGNPNAVNPKSGATGAMQIMEGTARDLGITDRKDPNQNIRGGARYIRQRMDARNGDMTLALIDYNWGMGNTDKWLANGAKFEDLPTETQGYLRKFYERLPRYQGVGQQRTPDTGRNLSVQPQSQTQQPQDVMPGRGRTSDLAGQNNPASVQGKAPWELTRDDLVRVTPRRFPKKSWRGEMYDANDNYMGSLYVVDGEAFIGEQAEFGNGQVVSSLPGKFTTDQIEKAGTLNVSAKSSVARWRFKNLPKAEEAAGDTYAMTPWNDLQEAISDASMSGDRGKYKALDAEIRFRKMLGDLGPRTGQATQPPSPAVAPALPVEARRSQQSAEQPATPKEPYQMSQEEWLGINDPLMQDYRNTIEEARQTAIDANQSSPADVQRAVTNAKRRWRRANPQVDWTQWLERTGENAIGKHRERILDAQALGKDVPQEALSAYQDLQPAPTNKNPLSVPTVKDSLPVQPPRLSQLDPNRQSNIRQLRAQDAEAGRVLPPNFEPRPYKRQSDSGPYSNIEADIYGRPTGVERSDAIADGELTPPAPQQTESAQLPAPKSLEVRPSTDDPNDVAAATFIDGRVSGNENVPTDSLIGGVRMNNQREQQRVQELADEIAKNGYISRLVVDDENNVVEGQHRLEALKLLGQTEVPITRITSPTSNMPVDAMREAVRSVANLRDEQVNQIVSSAAEMVNESGSAAKALEEWDLPAQYAEAYRAAIQASVSAPQQVAQDITQDIPEIPIPLVRAIRLIDGPDTNREQAIRAYGRNRADVELGDSYEADRAKKLSTAQKVYEKGQALAAKNNWDWEVVREKARQQLGLNENWRTDTEQKVYDQIAARQSAEYKAGTLSPVAEAAPTPAQTQREKRNALFLREEVIVDQGHPLYDQGVERASGPGMVRMAPQDNLAQVIESGSPRVYHETNLQSAKSIIQRAEAGPRNHTPMFVSDNIDLALGQGGKGYVLEFDPERANGSIAKGKPGMGISTGKEYTVSKTVRGALTGIIAPNQRGVASIRKIKGIENTFDFDNIEQVERGIRIPRKSESTQPQVTPETTVIGDRIGISERDQWRLEGERILLDEVGNEFRVKQTFFNPEIRDAFGKGSDASLVVDAFYRKKDGTWSDNTKRFYLRETPMYFKPTKEQVARVREEKASEALKNILTPAERTRQELAAGARGELLPDTKPLPGAKAKPKVTLSTNDALYDFRKSVRENGIKPEANHNPEDFGGKVPVGLFRKNARRTWDQWLQEAASAGLISPDATKEDFINLFRGASKKQVSTSAMEDAWIQSHYPNLTPENRALLSTYGSLEDAARFLLRERQKQEDAGKSTATIDKKLDNLRQQGNLFEEPLPPPPGEDTGQFDFFMDERGAALNPFSWAMPKKPKPPKRTGNPALDKLNRMFYRGEKLRRKVLQEQLGKTAITPKRLWKAFVRSVVDKRTDLPTKRLKKLVGDRAYLPSVLHQHMNDIEESVFRELRWRKIDRADFSKYLAVRRMQTERADMKNPLSPEEAQQAMDGLAKQLGPEGMKAMERAAQVMHQQRIPLIDKMQEYGLISENLAATLRDRENYATFNVLDFLEESYGKAPGSGIWKQLGTEREIEDPYTATMLKDVALSYAMTINRAARDTVRFLATNDLQSVQEAEKFAGDFKEAPRGSGLGLVRFRENGELKGVYIKKEIADLLATSPETLNLAVRVLDTINSPFRRAWVVNNPGFATWNTIRDFLGSNLRLPAGQTQGPIATPKNILTMPARLAKAYANVWHDVWNDVIYDRRSPYMEEMYRKGLFVEGRGYSARQHQLDDELARLQLRFNAKPQEQMNWFTRTFKLLFNDINQFSERLGKAAATKYMENQGYDTNSDEIIELLRNRGGSPDFLAKGNFSPIMNQLYMFSNVHLQSIRGLADAAKERPIETALKATAIVLLPKLVMKAAESGMMGEWAAQIMQAVPERDKENYTIIPLWLTDKGEAVYIPLPTEHMAQSIGTMLWMAMSDSPEWRTDQLTKTALGQIPYEGSTFSPPLQILMDAMDTARGLPVIDDWTGRSIVPDTELEAGGSFRWNAFLQGEWNRMFGGTIYRIKSGNESEVASELSKMLDIPGAQSLIRRVVRVSSRGEDDAYRNIIEPIEREQARISIQVRDYVQDAVSKIPPTANDAVIKRYAERDYRRGVREGAVPKDYQKAAFVSRYKGQAILKYGTPKQRAAYRKSAAAQEAIGYKTPPRSSSGIGGIGGIGGLQGLGGIGGL